MIIADLLQANFFVQPNFLTDNFAQKNWPKVSYKHVKGILSNCAKIIKKKCSSSCVAFKSTNFAEILKKIAHTCVLTSSAFRSSGSLLYPHYFLSKPLLANLAKLNVGQYLCPCCKVNATQYEWDPYFFIVQTHVRPSPYYIIILSFVNSQPGS